MKSVLLAGAFALGVAQPAFAGDLDAVRGDWTGSLMGQLTLVLHVADAVTLDSPDQGAAGIPAELTLKDGEYTLTLPSVGADYEAKLSGDGKTLSGEFHQNGQAFPLSFERGPAPAGQ